jgi:hypothetical protein
MNLKEFGRHTELKKHISQFIEENNLSLEVVEKKLFNPFKLFVPKNSSKSNKDVLNVFIFNVVTLVANIKGLGKIESAIMKVYYPVSNDDSLTTIRTNFYKVDIDDIEEGYASEILEFEIDKESEDKIMKEVDKVNKFLESLLGKSSINKDIIELFKQKDFNEGSIVSAAQIKGQTDGNNQAIHVVSKRGEFLYDFESNKKYPLSEREGYVNWQVGDKVNHQTFGLGSVVKVYKQNNTEIVDVLFESYGNKKLMANHYFLKKQER